MLKMISGADLLFGFIKDNQLFNNTVPAKLQSYMYWKANYWVNIWWIKKIIEDAECGFAFSTNNKKDFIKNTIYWKATKSFLLKLGQNGRKYYLDKFHSSKRKKKYLDC